MNPENHSSEGFYPEGFKVIAPLGAGAFATLVLFAHAIELSSSFLLFRVHYGQRNDGSLVG